jgi:hypothetical protein
MKFLKYALGIILVILMANSLSFAANLGFLWQYEVDEHTVSLWHFNEGVGDTAYDATDNHNDGIINGASWTGSGRFSGALIYDGINDYMRISNDASLSPSSQLSVEAWIYLYNYPDTSEGQALIVMKERQYALMVNFDGRPLITICDAGPWIWQPAMALEPIPCSTWVHVAGTFDKVTKEIKFFVNGWLQENVVYSSWSSWDTSHDLFIGCNRDIYNEDYFPGVIDEVRISDIVRDYYLYEGVSESRVFLDSAIINGIRLTSSNPVVLVEPGEHLVGNAWLHTYNEIAPTSIAPFGGTTSWGDHASSYWCIDSWIPTGHAHYKDSINVFAPNEPGQYHVSYAFQGEYGCNSVMSCTNRDAIWNDGNDIADWGSSVIDSAVNDGRVIVSYLFFGQYYVPTMVPATSIKIQVTPQRDSLIVASDTVCLDPRLHKVPLIVKNLDTLKAMTIPLHPEITCPDFVIDSVSFSGGRIENWESKTVVIGPDSIALGLVANLGGGTPPLLPGEGAIAYIYYSISCDPAHTGETCSFSLDTTTIQPENQHLVFVDNHDHEFIPYFEPGTTTVNLYRPGDANCNCEINIADVVAMINYLFINGPEPCPMDAGDANGDCNVNVVDAVYLINYLFIGGPAPVCGCASNPLLAGCCGGGPSFSKIAGIAQVGLVTSEGSTEDNQLMEVAASFGTEVAGVQLEFSYDPNEIQSIIPELTDRTKDMKLFFSAKNGMLKIGIIDLMGENLIPAGEGALIKLSIAGSNPTSLEIQKAILVDKHAQSFEVIILPKEESQASMPKNYILSQNMPNPFNPETEICYALPNDCHVRLTVYNVKGQKVKTLVNGFESTGHKTVRWDGTDENGQKVSSGIYFYRLEAGNFRQTHKMVLMK